MEMSHNIHYRRNRAGITIIFPSALEYFGATFMTKLLNFARRRWMSDPASRQRFVFSVHRSMLVHRITHSPVKQLSPRSELDSGVGARQDIDLQGRAEQCVKELLMLLILLMNIHE
jgi:hypothetical protein